MVYALFISLVLMLVFCIAWQKAKADISFLEGKAADFLDREEQWMKEIEMLKIRLNQRPQTFPAYADTTESMPMAQTASFDQDSSWIPGEPPSDHSEMEFTEEPRELLMVELGNVSMAFLQKLGVDVTASEETKNNRLNLVLNVLSWNKHACLKSRIFHLSLLRLHWTQLVSIIGKVTSYRSSVMISVLSPMGFISIIYPMPNLSDIIQVTKSLCKFLLVN